MSQESESLVLISLEQARASIHSHNLHLSNICIFFIDKKQYIDQKSQEVPKSAQEVNKKEPKGACEEPTNPNKKLTTLPTLIKYKPISIN